jgi:hypothetical protein
MFIIKVSELPGKEAKQSVWRQRQIRVIRQSTKTDWYRGKQLRKKMNK